MKRQISETDKWVYERQEKQDHVGPDKLKDDFKKYTRFYQCLLRRHLPEDKNLKVLDLPCGSGALVFMLLELGYKNVQGYDLDKGRIQTGRALGLPISEGDVFEILESNADQSVEAIFSLNFLEHLDKEDVITYMTLVNKKLAPGGSFFVVVPSADSPFGLKHIYNDFTHKWAPTASVLRTLLNNAGFNEVDTFGEHPVVGMRYGLIRVFAFALCTSFINLLLLGLSQRYDIWSPSMWAVAKKPHHESLG